MPTSDQAERRTATYIYGIVPGDVEAVEDAYGIGDPAGEVKLVRHGRVAAMVSEIDIDRPIGSPSDMKLHEELLDATAAADIPVLPLRFGAVMTGPEAVEENLLTPHHDLFSSALRELDGRVEYVVHGRFIEDAILSQVLSENPAVASKREQLRGTDANSAIDARIELGQMINQEVEAARDRKTEELIEALEPMVLAESVRAPASEFDAFNVAFLVELDRAEEFAGAVREFADESKALIETNLRGPLAAFDFIVTDDPDGS